MSDAQLRVGIEEASDWGAGQSVYADEYQRRHAPAAATGPGKPLVAAPDAQCQAS